MEALELLRMHRQRGVHDTAVQVASMTSALGFVPMNQDVLDVGCGQMLKHATWLAQGNRVMAIDQAVIPARPVNYIAMWRQNGPLRVAKTLGRRALGIDRRVRSDIARHLGVPDLALPDVATMDAGDMTFDDETFDLVYSISVFEHLEDPKSVVSEIKRVLRPGGFAYIHVHLYTSDTGAHDPRIMSGKRGDNLPYWAHLRSGYARHVRSNSYLNKWSLDQWRSLFDDMLPGGILRLSDRHPHLELALQTLRQTQELSEHTDEELLTESLAVVWQKP